MTTMQQEMAEPVRRQWRAWVVILGLLVGLTKTIETAAANVARSARARVGRATVGAVVLVLALSTAAAADRPAAGDDLQAARQASAPFHDLDAAMAAGHTEVFHDVVFDTTCFAQPGVGAMGHHYMNPALRDGVVDASRPEVLVYESRPDGSLKLVAVEYWVSATDWAAAGNTEPPSLFGRQFDAIGVPNRLGTSAFYALHAWIWKPNPTGMFAMWNPKVSCP